MNGTPKEEDELTLQAVSDWLEEHREAKWFSTDAEIYYRPLLQPYWAPEYAGHNYYLKKAYADPLLDSIKDFFTDIGTFAGKPWDVITGGIENLSGWIDAFWTDLTTGIVDFVTKIKEEIGDLATFAGNMVTLLWWELTDELKGYISAIFRPVTDAWDAISDTLVDWYEKIQNAITTFLQEPYQWILDLAADLWASLASVKDMIWDGLVVAADTVGLYLGTKLQDFAPVVVEYLRDALLWLWDTIKTGFLFTVGGVLPAAWEAASGALGWLKDEFTNLVGLAYEELMAYAKSFAPMTPGKSLELAGLMFGSAVGFGALAHGMALAVEVIPNLKYMGVHYMSAFSAHMGGFGLISSATMGVVAALALRTPFTYYLNDVLRPIIPDDKLLIEFRAKRELNAAQFKSYMRFHGYSDEWIDKIDSWLWKDPRLFEILYCADVTVPPKEWLERKFERAGYEDIDIATLVKVVERRTTRSPRTYYTTALRRNYRHGFITELELEEGIEALEMAPDAIDWIKRAGALDNLYEVNSDWVTAFKNAYRNDLITEDECWASLLAIGLPKDRVEAIIELEWVRRQPRILSEERKEIEAQWREIQGEYSRVYIESFRRGLITEVQLSVYLTAIGVNDKVAKMTARHEAIKLVPKPKPEVITVPAIPVVPTPPTYEE